jgi:two-component system OmpR family response regulator
MKALIVEDDRVVALVVDRVLRQASFTSDFARTGAQAILKASVVEFDVIVLDVGLPDVDGFEVARQLRDDGCWAPILMLTGHKAVEDRVAGLDAGADDYLGKPFEPPELLARVRALLRRAPKERPAALAVGDLRLDPAKREVHRADQRIELGPKEFALLELLMRRAPAVISRAEILDSIWGYRYGPKVVDVYISYLRDKIDRPFGVSSINAVRGVGYVLGEPAEDSASA